MSVVSGVMGVPPEQPIPQQPLSVPPMTHHPLNTSTANPTISAAGAKQQPSQHQQSPQHQQITPTITVTNEVPYGPGPGVASQGNAVSDARETTPPPDPSAALSVYLSPDPTPTSTIGSGSADAQNAPAFSWDRMANRNQQPVGLATQMDGGTSPSVVAPMLMNPAMFGEFNQEGHSQQMQQQSQQAALTQWQQLQQFQMYHSAIAAAHRSAGNGPPLQPVQYQQLHQMQRIPMGVPMAVPIDSAATFSGLDLLANSASSGDEAGSLGRSLHRTFNAGKASSALSSLKHDDVISALASGSKKRSPTAASRGRPAKNKKSKIDKLAPHVPLPIEIHPLTQDDLHKLDGQVNQISVCILRNSERCPQYFGIKQHNQWCKPCQDERAARVNRARSNGHELSYNDANNIIKRPPIKECGFDTDVQRELDAAMDATGPLSVNRRAHGLLLQVCATPGCHEVVQKSGRSRFTRCAKCRRSGEGSVSEDGTYDSERSNYDSALSDVSRVDIEGNDADHDDEDELKPRRDKQHHPMKSRSPDLTVSRKGRVRVPTKVFSPSGSPMIRRVPDNRFNFDVDVDSDGNIQTTPKRSKHELMRGSPRLARGVPVWSPRSPIGEESEGEEIRRNVEPRIYISPAPNWFVRPPVGADPAVIAKLISQYHAKRDREMDIESSISSAAGQDNTADKKMVEPTSEESKSEIKDEAPSANAESDVHAVSTNSVATPAVEQNPMPGIITLAPAPRGSDTAAGGVEVEIDMDTDGVDTGVENELESDAVESNDEPSLWLPSTRSRTVVSPIVATSGNKVPAHFRSRSDSVTIGLPSEDDPDHDAVRKEAAEADEQQLELAVENVLTNSTSADFDFQKCRKCQVQYENDEDDLIVCTYCSLVFHGGCETPVLDWSPSESFCSVICFEKFKNTSEGIELFKRNMVLSTGHLRKYSACFTNQSCDAAMKKPTMQFRGRDAPYTIPSFQLNLAPGQCVSLRAEPHADDPRIEWPAIIRHVFYHRSGYPLFFVTWLEPINPTKRMYAPLPAGPRQMVPCLSSTCPVRRGDYGHSGAICYSASCRKAMTDAAVARRKRNDKSSLNIKSEPNDESSVKVPSHLRNTLSAGDLRRSQSRRSGDVKLETTDDSCPSPPHPEPEDEPLPPTPVKPLNIELPEVVRRHQEKLDKDRIEIERLEQVRRDQASRIAEAELLEAEQADKERRQREQLEREQMEAQHRKESELAQQTLDQCGLSNQLAPQHLQQYQEHQQKQLHKLQQQQLQTLEQRQQKERKARQYQATTAAMTKNFEGAAKASSEGAGPAVSAAEFQLSASNSQKLVPTRPAIGRNAPSGSSDSTDEDDTEAEQTDKDETADDMQTDDPTTDVDGTTTAAEDTLDEATDSDASAMRVDSDAGSNSDATIRPKKPRRRRRPDPAEGLQTDGKGGIICSCGRIFANGQALGGHRGKCKVPRERAKAMRERENSTAKDKRRRVDNLDQISDKKKKSNKSKEKDKEQGKEKEVSDKRDKKSSDKKEKGRKDKKKQNSDGAKAKSESGMSKAEVERRARKERADKQRAKRTEIIIPTMVHPVYCIKPFDVRDYKLGRNERRPQVPASLVKIHSPIFPDLPDSFFTVHRDLAKHRFSNMKLLDDYSDASLKGPVDEPELDGHRGYLETNRDAPRRLGFLSPTVKTTSPTAKKPLGRTRSRNPTAKMAS